MNTTSNTVSEIQTSNFDLNTDANDIDSDSMGLNHLPDIVMTSDSSDPSDIDKTE